MEFMYGLIIGSFLGVIVAVVLGAILAYRVVEDED